MTNDFKASLAKLVEHPCQKYTKITAVWEKAALRNTSSIGKQQVKYEIMNQRGSKLVKKVALWHAVCENS